MIKALKSNSGLSLMEILVAGLMFAILVATVIMVISPIMMAYSRANSLAGYNTILDSIGNVITSEFSGARPAPDLPDFEEENFLKFSSGSGIVTFRADDGHLRRNVGIEEDIGHLVFPEEFYGGMEISFNVTLPYPPDGFLIKVAIGRPGTAIDEKISREFAVRPIMLG